MKLPAVFLQFANISEYLNFVKPKEENNCITHAARPRSLMRPLVFGFGVELEKTFGSKWLINHLSRLGSYREC